MKQLKLFLLAFLVMMTATSAEAKTVKVDNLYMFGFSASFKDSVVYVTDIQNVPQARINEKTKFLLDRDQYSYQLKNFLSETLQQTGRICLIIYDTDKKKAEKKYVKLMKKYKKGYQVLYLNETQFRFKVIEDDADE